MYERKALDKILDKNLHINSKYHVIFKGMNAIAAMLLMGISGSVLAQSYTEVVHPSLDNYDSTVKNLISKAGNKYTYNFGGGDLNISDVYQDHIKGIDVSGGYQIKVSNLANLKLETNYAKFLHAVYFYAGTYQSEGNTYDKKLEYGDGLIEVNNNTALGTFKSDGFHIEGIANTNLTEPSVILGDLTIKSTVDGQGTPTLTGTFGFADGIHLTSQNVIVKGGNVDITSKAKGVDQAISYGIFADNADNSITLDSAKISAISTGNHSKNGSAAYGIRLDKSTQVKIDGALEISAYVEDTQEVIARGLDFEDENNDKGSEGIFLGDNIIEATAKAQNNAYVTAVLAKNQSTIVLGKSTICAKTVLTGGIDTENLKLESFGIASYGYGTNVTLNEGRVLNEIDASSYNATITGDNIHNFGVHTEEGGHIVLGSEGKTVSIKASGTQKSTAIQLMTVNGEVDMHGAVIVEAGTPVALSGLGTVKNDGIFKILGVNEGSTNTFRGTYIQTAGSTYLSSDLDYDFFAGNVNLYSGYMQAGDLDISSHLWDNEEDSIKNAAQTLALARHIRLGKDVNVYIGDISRQKSDNYGLYFGENSALVVTGALTEGEVALVNGYKVASDTQSYAIDANSNDISVASGSKLYITDAKADKVYGIVNNLSNINGNVSWSDEQVAATSRLLHAKVINDGSKIYVITVKDLKRDLPKVLAQNALDNLNPDTKSKDKGTEFLSKAFDSVYMPSESEGVKLVNELSRAAISAGVQNSAFRVAERMSDIALEHLSLGFFDDEHHIHDNDERIDVWAMPVYGNTYTQGLDVAGNSVRGNYYGITVGADTKLDEIFAGELRVGASFNLGYGEAESKGTVSSITDDYNFGGINLLARWKRDNFNLIGNLGLGFSNHDVSMELPSSMQMSKAQTVVDTTNITLDLRAEYLMKTAYVDILPHIGVRYMALHTDNYALKSDGKALNYVSSDTQNIYQVPVGVLISKNYEVSEWLLKSRLDLSLVPVFGDKDAKTHVVFTGTEKVSDEFATRILDTSAIAASVGFQASKGNFSLGLDYALKTQSHERQQSVNLHTVYKF